MYDIYHIGEANNNILFNSIEINAIIKLLESKGLIDANEYSVILKDVGEQLLNEAESKGLIDKRMMFYLVQKLYE